MKRILIAGVGNIFCGDDAFGVETVRALAARAWPAAVRVVDFGIRAYDLAYAITEGYDAVVLVDAAARGGAPGTVSLIEPDASPRDERALLVNGHSLNPALVLQLVAALEGRPGRLYLVGCEPAVLECDGGQMGLSAPVAAAVPRAVAMIQALVAELLGEHELMVTERSFP